MAPKSYVYSRNVSLYERLYFWFRNKKCRMLILFTIFVAALFTYHYNNTSESMVQISHEENDIYVQIPTEGNTEIATLTTSTKTLSNDQAHTKPSSKITFEMHPLTQSRLKSTTTKNKKNIVPMTPLRNVPLRLFNFNPNLYTHCNMFSCFNYSRCPLKGRFSIFLYENDILSPVVNNFTVNLLREMLNANNVLTTKPEEACIYLVLVGEIRYNESEVSHKFAKEAAIKTLAHWRRAGRNHVLLNFAQSGLIDSTGDAIVAQTNFIHNQFRPGFDVVLPPPVGPISGDVWSLAPPIAPPRRKYLLSFQGTRSSEMKSSRVDSIISNFNEMKTSARYDKFYLQFQCKYVDKLFELKIRDWALCSERNIRRKVLRKSTFVLIMAPIDTSYASTNLLQTRLYEALESGAIPVILGGDRIRLPYEEVLDWRKAVVSLPTMRVTELHFLLKTMSYEDILAFRSQGRMLWERYMGTVQAVMDTLLGTIRSRLNIPAKPVSSVTASVYTTQTGTRKAKNSTTTSNYKRNFTVGLLNGYEFWNVWGDPFALYPQLPWDPLMTPEPRFEDSSLRVQYPGTCKPLAGDHPVEQFTVVILTCNRTTLLKKTLNRIYDIPNLNKIVVVVNGPSKPSTASWPKSGPPIVLVRGERNSLNNRFLPYHLIETEAVFCADDDGFPGAKDIFFAFKVWREHRDQIVGFFGRNYEWDYKNHTGFLYTTRYKITRNESVDSTLCEVSMILTGAAFIHRYYLWAYWRMLPNAVRNFVDRRMNCEDIAMNFLVSHITRKPPVTVTTHWNKISFINATHARYNKLSNYRSHYKDRDKCMQFFTKVMGYNPLLTTHYRAKSFATMPNRQQL